MTKKNKTMLDQVEEINENNLMDNLKSNEQLKKALILARNMSRKLRDDIVPQLSKGVISVMKEMLENKTEIADWKTMKFLRGHCFTQWIHSCMAFNVSFSFDAVALISSVVFDR